MPRLPNVPQSDDTDKCYWSNGGALRGRHGRLSSSPLHADLTTNAIGLTCVFIPD